MKLRETVVENLFKLAELLRVEHKPEEQTHSDRLQAAIEEARGLGISDESLRVLQDTQREVDFQERADWLM